MNRYSKFEKVFDKTVASKRVHESICYIENSAGDFTWSKGYGGKELTIADLLFQKSGLPDWFLDGKSSYAKRMVREAFQSGPV